MSEHEPPCGDREPWIHGCYCPLPLGHHGPHRNRDCVWPNLNEMTPCPSTELAVLGMVGEPAMVRCGLLEGHGGPHRMAIEWVSDD